MADQSLQAFQLGASLFDRAQTQRRIMDQFQVNAAESVLRQQQMDLQNKIQQTAYAQALEEQKAQVDEFDQFQKFNTQVSDYLNSDKNPFPVVPTFKSKAFRAEADRSLNNLEKYSNRAMLLKAQERAAMEADRISAAMLNNASKYGAFKIDPESGKVSIDYNVVNQRAQQAFEADVSGKEARAQAALDRVQIAQQNLERLTNEGASRNALAQANMALREELGRANLDLRRQLGEANVELGRQRVAQGETRLGQGQQRIDISREQGAARLEQGQQRIDLSRELGQQRIDIAREKAKAAAFKPTKVDQDELEFAEAALNGLKPLEPYLAEDIYGPGFNLKVKGGAMTGLFGVEREANQAYENLRNKPLFARGGKALTKPEIERITAGIGSPTDVGFAQRVETYKLNTARDIRNRVDKLLLQGVGDNPNYSRYLQELDKRAEEIIGPREFGSLEEAQNSNLPDGTRIIVGGRSATYRK